MLPPSKHDLISKLFQAIESVLWNPQDGIWYDFDLKNQIQRRQFVATNVHPLWTESFPARQFQIYAPKVLTYLEKTGVLDLPGGVPTTMKDSGQQWDKPNAWPPQQHVIMESLLKMGTELAKKRAYELAKKYIDGAYVAYLQKGTMYEKVSLAITVSQ